MTRTATGYHDPKTGARAAGYARRLRTDAVVMPPAPRRAAPSYLDEVYLTKV